MTPERERELELRRENCRLRQRQKELGRELAREKAHVKKLECALFWINLNLSDAIRGFTAVARDALGWPK